MTTGHLRRFLPLATDHWPLLMIPDWQLPPGVDRGLWDYLHSAEMVAGYDAQMAASPLAAFDVRYCEDWFPTPGRLLDMGCGTGRLAIHFARKGYACVGVDLSDEMLARAAANDPGVEWRKGNLVEPADLPDAGFDYAACLFSTLGMVRGRENRRAVVANAFRVLRPGGRFVLHVHNRYFRRLRGRGLWAGEVTMPQAYAGARLTLYHFSRREAVRVLGAAGFRVLDVRPVGPDGPLPAGWWLPSFRAYGYLIAAGRP